MTTNEMYQSALDNMNQTGERYGVSKFALPNGDVVICFIRGVAGRSIRAKHMRTEYSLKMVNEQYGKTISRNKVVELLK